MAGTTETLRGTLNASGIFAPLTKHLAALDDFLEAQVADFVPAAQESLRYTFTHRGKRLRPALVFFSGWTDAETVPAALVRGAAIVELIHLATLVHDDILDDARLRHSSPTLFAKYGSHTAVLLGDAILAQALKLMADFDDVALCRAVAVAMRKICNGEIWQTAERGNSALTLDDYFRIIEMKTGELFEISALIGATLSGGGLAKGKAFSEFGRRLGRAYQIFDDVIDFLGDETEIGKTLGTDLASGKFTLPEILFLQKIAPDARERFLADVAAGTVALAPLVEKMRALGVFEESREYFLKETAAAAEALAPFADDEGARHLLAISEFVASRVRKIA